jgi:hypothetical protein
MRGETQSGTTSLSRKQENVTPECSGPTVSVNVALVLSVVSGAAGTSAVIVVVGAPTTVHVYGAEAGPALPLGSTARTSRVCSPSDRLSSSVLSGGAPAHCVHSGSAGAGAGSSAHSNEASGSLLEKTN